MNKTPYLAAAIVALMATAPTAYAEGHIYGKLGANISSSTSLQLSKSAIGDVSGQLNANPGVMPEFALGYDWGNGFAVELSYQKSGGSGDNLRIINYDTDPNGIISNIPTTSGDIIFRSKMLRGIYNLPINNTAMYNPFIGLGIGTTNIKIDHFDYKINDDAIKFNTKGSATNSSQLTLGNRFKFGQGWFADVAVNYTYNRSVTLKDDDGFSNKFDSSSVTSVSFVAGKSF